MILNRLSFLIFSIPIVIGINTTILKVGSAANNSANVTLAHNAALPKVNNSVEDLPIMTEGGSIGTKQTIATAAKGTLLTKTQSDPLDTEGTTLLTKTQSDPHDTKSATLSTKTQSDPLETKDTTLIKTQSDLDIPTKNTGKSVVGRKGVNFKEENPEENKLANATTEKFTSIKASESNTKAVLTNNATANTKVTAHLKPTKTESTSPVPHKPTVLSYAALESAGDKTLSLIEEGIKHKQATNPGSHPGMIMPVVITILVVPMFAVLGYMALKRGQEAWKNRHYKRMDFLLDGMYND